MNLLAKRAPGASQYIYGTVYLNNTGSIPLGYRKIECALHVDSETQPLNLCGLHLL